MGDERIALILRHFAHFAFCTAVGAAGQFSQPMASRLKPLRTAAEIG